MLNLINLKNKLTSNISLIILITSIIFFLTMFSEPISQNTAHSNRLWLSVCMIIMLFLNFFLNKKQHINNSPVFYKIKITTLILLCLIGSFNYYHFNLKKITGNGDYTDIAYYYLNSKYLKELGYFNLYSAMLYADFDHKNIHIKHIPQYRDLNDYKIKPIKHALNKGKTVKENNFTVERWNQFKHDVEWFLVRRDSRSLRNNFFVDHGYNPPATWAVLGNTLSNLVPIEKVKLITCVDFVFVATMLISVVWAFGLEAMLFMLMFFLCSFSGRWPVLGQSLLRFDWSSTLVIAICFLKKNKPFISGSLIAYASLSRIFPAIFSFPWVVLSTFEFLKYKRITKPNLSFLKGVLSIVLAFIFLTLLFFGKDIFIESAKNALMHNKTYSSHRVGLGDVLVFRGEFNEEALKKSGGIYPKELKIQQMHLLLNLIGVFFLALIAVYVILKKDKKPTWEYVPLCIIPFFCMTNPQINYYYIRMLLVLWHLDNINKKNLHFLGLMFLFVIEILTNFGFVAGWPRYTVTTMTSLGMLVYVLSLIVIVVNQICSELRKNKLSPSKA